MVIMNQFKTFILMLVLNGILSCGTASEEEAVRFMLLSCRLDEFVMYWLDDKIVLRMYVKQKKVTNGEVPEFNESSRTDEQSQVFRCPRVYI